MSVSLPARLAAQERATAHAQHLDEHRNQDSGRAGFQLYRRALFPEFLELIESARFGLHDMHHHTAEIDQNPLAFAFTFDTDDRLTELARGIHDPMRQGPHLPR